MSNFCPSRRFSSIPPNTLDLDWDNEALVPIAPFILLDPIEDPTKEPILFLQQVSPIRKGQKRECPDPIYDHPFLFLWEC